MRITPISHNQFITKSTNPKQKTNNINFKNYESAFNKCVSENLKTRNKMKEVIINLFENLRTEASVHPNLLKIYIQSFQNGLFKIEEFLDNINKNFKSGASVAKNNKDSKLAYIFDEELIFSHPKNNNEFISIHKKDENCLEINRSDGYSSSIYKYFPQGNIKSITEVSGKGIGLVSSTTHYDKNGEERTFRNLLDLFGI